MWHALRTELAYSRSYLVGGFGIAAGVILIVTVVFAAVGEQGPPAFAAAGIRGMFLMMAPLVVGFTVQTWRSQEHRARLLLAAPLTPRQLAGIMVLLPVVLFAFGTLAAAVAIGVESLVRGRFEAETVNIVRYVGGLMFMINLMGLLALEATAATRERRLRQATLGWGVFVVAVPLYTLVTLGAALGRLGWPQLDLGNLLLAVMAAAATVMLYGGRTDFTR